MTRAYIKLSGEINKDSVFGLVEDLHAHRYDEVVLIADSHGGNHECGMLAHRAIRAHGRVDVVGYNVYSACLTAACGGRTFGLCRDGKVLPHETRIAFGDGDVATASTLTRYSAECERGTREIKDVLRQKSGLPLRAISKLLAMDIPLTAAQALRAGIVDFVIPADIPRLVALRPMPYYRSFNMFAHFKNMPPGARRAYDEANARFAARR